MSSSPSECHHSSCIISSMKGFRNGVFYGGRIRIVHSLVMSILFKKGSMKERLINILSLTKDHSMYLAFSSFIFKMIKCILTKIQLLPQTLIVAFSGLISGYLSFSENSNVHLQITLYTLGRSVLGFSEVLVNKGILPNINAYPAMAAIIWALVMFLFEDDRTCLQGSLVSSMQFLYKDSDKKMESWTELIPVEIPEFIKKFF